MHLFGMRERTVATVGLSGHGKTVFLASLFWDSFFALSVALHDEYEPFTVRAVSPKADDVFYGNAQLLHDLTVPPGNPRTRPEPAILEFSGVPSAGPRWWKGRESIRLAFYDIAGEVFASDELTREYAPFLAHANDIIFLFDPTHPEFSALSAARLVDLIYRVPGSHPRKNIIIALSKMDELRSTDEWAGIIDHYWPDAPPTPETVPDYLRQMESLSRSLRLWWTDPQRQAHNLIHSLPKNARFCAVSSLGTRPTTGENGRLRLAAKPKPFRVRDPLFWIFRAAGVM
jgi:hypothetical protein